MISIFGNFKPGNREFFRSGNFHPPGRGIFKIVRFYSGKYTKSPGKAFSGAL